MFPHISVRSHPIISIRTRLRNLEGLVDTDLHFSSKTRRLLNSQSLLAVIRCR